jgi:hypothetical protein
MTGKERKKRKGLGKKGIEKKDRNGREGNGRKDEKGKYNFSGKE